MWIESRYGSAVTAGLHGVLEAPQARGPLIYDLTLPIGDLRIAEYFGVSGGRITAITHIHDMVALRAAGAGP
jgi:hypothetical protein